MVISVMDIQNKEFERSFRGYNMDDVDDFLENLALDYDIMIKETRELRDQFGKLTEERKQYQKLAESADKAIIESQEKINKIKEETETELQTVRAEADREIERLNQEYTILKRNNKELQEQILELNKEGMGFDKIEETVQSAISRSQEAAEEVLANARLEAEQIKQQAEIYKNEVEAIKKEAESETVQIKEEYEVLLNQNKELQDEIALLEEKNKKYEKLEETVHNAIIVAQEAADDLKNNAKNDSELIKKEAEEESRRIIEEARYQANRIIMEHEDLQKQTQDFKLRFRSFIEAQLASLEVKDLTEPLAEEDEDC